MRLATTFIATALTAILLIPTQGYAQSLLPPIDLTGEEVNSIDTRVLPPPADITPVLPSDILRRSTPADFGSDLVQQPFYACACGCGIYDVGTSSMLPASGKKGMVWEQYDYQDQVNNWNGHASAPASYNPDKKIETSFYTTGLQYFFDRSWGIQFEVPIADRYFSTKSYAPGNPIMHSTWTALGDVRIEGIYAGFSEDQSIGIDFGLKLPTGNFTHNNAYGDVDRDSEIGSGSTDLLLGGFVRHTLLSSYHLDGFGQILLDLPFMFSSDSYGSYRPGAELDGAIGLYYTGLRARHFGITPIAQVLFSVRRQDSGSAAAEPVASGYQRILLAPGVEIDVHPVMFYADVELPVYQNTNGDQLVGSFLIKGSISYRF